jgi:hypothetical protein
MKALVRHRKEGTRSDPVTAPRIKQPRDASVRIIYGAICTSARHAWPRGAARSHADRSWFPQGLLVGRSVARCDLRTPPAMPALPAVANAVAYQAASPNRSHQG